MFFLFCQNCGHKIKIPVIKYQIIGISISIFGVFGWFSYLFAGSGHAFLIACVIFITGIVTTLNAKTIALDLMKDKICPKCYNVSLKETPPNNDTLKEKDNYPTTKIDEIKNCPKCKTGILKIRNGKYGKFWGCNNYPSCNYTKNINNYY